MPKDDKRRSTPKKSDKRTDRKQGQEDQME